MKKITFLILIVSLGVNAQVDETKEKTRFSLEEAQAYALENSYSVVDKQIEFEKAKKTIQETAAMGLPQISGSFDFSYNAQLAKQPVPAEFFGGAPGTYAYIAFGVKYQNVASLNLNQLILDGSYFVALRASKVYKESARLDKEVTELEVKRDVAEAYYGVLVSQKVIDVLKENVKSLEKNFSETRALYENGFLEEQDADQLELLVTNTKNSLLRSERQYDFALMMLNFNLGRDVNAPLELTDSITDLIVSEEVLTNNVFDISNNVNFKYIEVQAQGAELSLKNEKWKYAPTLSGFVRHGQSNFQNDLDRTFSFNEFWIPNTALGLSLKWNILQGFSRPATVQKAKLDLEKAQIAKELKANQLQLNYNQARTAFQYAFDTYNSEIRNVELSKKIRNKTAIKYKEGLSSSMDLTQAQTQYLQAEQNYLNALQTLLNAKEELIQTIGKL